MNLTIFGATGMVGKQLVQQALFNGYKVKAFGRNVYTTDFLPVNSQIKNENLQLIQGALFDEDEVYAAIKESDAVLSAIGGDFNGTDKARTLGIKNIIKQMQKAGVKRIIAVGGSGILNADENTLLINHKDYPKQYIPVGKEHQKAYELLKESGLAWTIIGSPEIYNNGPTGHFVTRADYEPEPNNHKINAGDLAMFMLAELKKNEFVCHRVGISN